VVDEHGGTEGIATIEDVVAELVGTIADEGEPRPDPVRQLAEDRWEVDAAADVDELESALGVELPHGDSVTVGGLVIALAETIPEVGESVTIPGFRFTVTAASGRRIETVAVKQTGDEPPR
jgi:CBS domain containing-hemolysin-like protein